MGNDFGSPEPDKIVIMSYAGGNKIDCYVQEYAVTFGKKCYCGSLGLHCVNSRYQLKPLRAFSMMCLYS